MRTLFASRGQAIQNPVSPPPIQVLITISMPSDPVGGSAPDRRSIPISQAAYSAMVHEIAGRPPEAGGLLLGPSNSRLVTHFLFDDRGRVTPATWTPDHEWLNATVKPFLNCGIDVKGFCHSHPSGYARPSTGDRTYLIRTMANPRNVTDEIFFPIFCDGLLHPFLVTSDSIRREEDWALPARFQFV